MKISNWEQLIGVKLVTKNKLYAKVEKEKRQSIINIFLVENAATPIAVIDWVPTLKDTVDALRKFGFDVDYKEPFNLGEFLKENLEPKEFNFNERNFYFAITEYSNIEVICDDGVKALNCKYFNSIYDAGDIGKVLRNESVTIGWLNLTLKELGWL